MIQNPVNDGCFPIHSLLWGVNTDPTKSRAVQHLNMIFIRAWYINTPQQPPPPGVAAVADIDDAELDAAYADPEDWYIKFK